MILQNFDIFDSFVTLRKLKTTDKKYVIELLSDPDVMAYIGPRRPMSENEIDNWLADNINRYNREWNRWAVALKNSDEFIGMVGIQVDGNKYDFGYYFRKAFWGQRLIKSSIELAIHSVRLAKIKSEAFIANGNIRSIKIAEKIGLNECFDAVRNGELGRCYYV